MSFTGIRNALKTHFDNLKATLALDPPGTQIGIVYDYNETNVTNYPAIMIESEALDSDFGSNTQMMRSYTYSITVHQTIEEVLGRETASKRLDLLLDSIINSLDADFTLGGVVNQITPVGARKTMIEDSEAGKKIVFTLQFKAEVLSPTFSNC